MRLTGESDHKAGRCEEPASRPASIMAGGEATDAEEAKRVVEVI